jgi:hypothetical protein
LNICTGLRRVGAKFQTGSSPRGFAVVVVLLDYFSVVLILPKLQPGKHDERKR